MFSYKNGNSLFATRDEQSTFPATLLSFLRVFFGHKRPQLSDKIVDDLEEQSVLNSSPSSHSGCIFCGASKENGFNVIWEVSMCLCVFCCSTGANACACLKDDYYTVFTDINPSAEHHLQLIPKQHIGKYLHDFPYELRGITSEWCRECQRTANI